MFRLAAALLLAAVMVSAAWAQDASSMPPAPSAQTQNAMPTASQPFNVREYAKPRSHFSELCSSLHASARGSSEPCQYAPHRSAHA